MIEKFLTRKLAQTQSRKELLHNAGLAILVAAAATSLSCAEEPTIVKDDGHIQLSIYLPQGIEKPEKGYLSYLFQPGIFLERRTIFDSLVKKPFRLASVFQLTEETLLGCSIALGRSDEEVTRLVANTRLSIKNLDQAHKLRIDWENWHFVRALWDDKDIPKKISPNTTRLIPWSTLTNDSQTPSSLI